MNDEKTQYEILEELKRLISQYEARTFENPPYISIRVEYIYPLLRILDDDE